MRWFDWNEVQGSLPLARMFEYTEQPLVDQFGQQGQPDFAALGRLPCLFMNEGTGAEVCRVGTIARTRIVGREVVFDYVLDPEVPPLENSLIHANRLAMDMPQDFEFSRNHWAVKMSISTACYCGRSDRAGNALPCSGSNSTNGSSPNSSL